ncbi:MAG: hypothetical protein ABIK09_03855 [Pseudomonadota bacterium]
MQRWKCLSSLVIVGACFLVACGSGSGGGEVADAVDADGASDLGPADVPPDTPDDGAGGDAAPDAVSTDTEEETLSFPDPTFFHKVDSAAMASAQVPWVIDEPVQYRTVEALADLDVRCLSTAGDTLWAGTASGLHRYDDLLDGFVAVPLTDGVEAPVVDLARRLDGWGRLVILQADRVIWLDPDGGPPVVTVVEGQALTAVTVAGGWTWVGTQAQGVWGGPAGPGIVDPADLDPVLSGSPILDLAGTEGGGIHVITADAYRYWSSPDATPVLYEGLPEGGLTAVSVGDPYPWIGGSWGVARVDGPGDYHVIPAGLDGLPLGDITALDVGADRLVMGHSKGATLLVDPLVGGAQPWGEKHHYANGRWIPSNDVRDVVVDGLGRHWIATAAGITRIDWNEHSFAEKADAFEAEQDAHFWRLGGFVAAGISIDDPWTPTLWKQHDHDNDGLWTQMQIGAWCYGFAATGDGTLYDKARKAMNLMELQVDIPAVDFEAAGLGRGFVTRSLVRDDEPDLFAQKATESNWHLVEWTDGHDYYWKDDTSSDEITGHFYGYPLYYDLCAKDDGEREEIAGYAAAIASYIIDGGLQLIDLDGVKTSHGHWAPEQIGMAALGIEACMEAAGQTEDPVGGVALCLESWMGGGWLNSIEILGVLLSTWHMTGDTTFYDAYEELITVHRYDLVASPHDETVTIVEPSMMNHSDHELAMLAYQTLIRYEPDDTRRQLWIDGLLFLMDHEAAERNPLWNAYTALAAGLVVTDMEPALQSLREMPFDLREWPMDNSHRLDAADWPNDRFDDPQFDAVFPYDEIRTVWWNGNLYEKAPGGSPKSLQGPLAWLLPYWALRYAGVISE